MKPPSRSVWTFIVNVLALIFIVFVMAALILGVSGVFAPLPPGELQMGMVVVLAITVLLTVITVTVSVFSRLDLANRKHALGLPPGSVRALIALFLIMVFIIMSVYLFRTIAVGVPAAAEQLAMQLVTVLATLVTAVSAFYFAKTEPTQDGAPPKKAVPFVVESIDPPQAPPGQVIIKLTGTGFVPGITAKLAQTGTTVPKIDSTNVTFVDASKIECVFNLTGKPSGQWDVVANNPDGSQATKFRAFQIT
jgi:hypothetical protein